jgi:hypothetical protein
VPCNEADNRHHIFVIRGNEGFHLLHKDASSFFAVARIVELPRNNLRTARPIPANQSHRPETF